MSLSAFIDINLKESSTVDFIGLIESISKHGWELNDHGEIVYLPLGDKDDFSWTAVPLSSKALIMEELRKKQRVGEIIGVVVAYKNTNIGGNLLFLKESHQVSLSLSMGRQSLENNITDFGWYLDRLGSWIATFKTEIDNIYFCQSDSGGQIEYEERWTQDLLDQHLKNHMDSHF